MSKQLTHLGKSHFKKNTTKLDVLDTIPHGSNVAILTQIPPLEGCCNFNPDSAP